MEKLTNLTHKKMEKQEQGLTPLQEQQPTQLAPQMLDPQIQIDFARKVAKGLMELVKGSSLKPIKLKADAKEYLYFEHWQTIAKFFNASAGTKETEEIIKDGKTIGFSATAVVYDNRAGNIIGSAEADCRDSEAKWKGKPEFQLKSMAQTRACAKALRNVYGWVATIAGFGTTPAEELDAFAPAVAAPAPRPAYTPRPVAAAAVQAEVIVCQDCGKRMAPGVITFSQKQYSGNNYCMDCQHKHLDQKTKK